MRFVFLFFVLFSLNLHAQKVVPAEKTPVEKKADDTALKLVLRKCLVEKPAIEDLQACVLALIKQNVPDVSTDQP